MPADRTTVQAERELIALQFAVHVIARYRFGSSFGFLSWAGLDQRDRTRCRCWGWADPWEDPTDE